MGFVFDVDVTDEEDGFSAVEDPLVLGLVIVPLDCLVVTAGDEDPRVVSFNSAHKNPSQRPKEKELGERRILLVSFQDMAGAPSFDLCVFYKTDRLSSLGIFDFQD